MSSLVHPTAIVDRHAELGADVEVGPYCVVGAGARIDEGTRLLSHVVVTGRTSIGKRNVVHPFAVLGGPPQLRKERAGTPSGAPGRLVVGDDNVIREHVTVNLASADSPTTIGSKNLVMAGAHLAHDVVVGSFCVIANGVQLAGHVVVEDWVTFGGLAGVAQWLRVGEGAFVAGGAMCEREVPPFVIVQGDRARVRALNVVGLERRGVPAASIAALEHAFKRLFVAKAGGFGAALATLDRTDPYVAKLAASLARPGR
ncbi:MAG: acyl-ACP--UDP-N-acetylglucosamine O-acyltransferase [Deltaproteobacteria bacterium]|nr:acyl-ACP--UDP-N-acetylglucosamine O-acyltransferase [Deltaproteobacteria bacterium]